MNPCDVPGPDCGRLADGKYAMAKSNLQIAAAAGAASERRKSSREDLVVRVDYQTVDDLFSEFARNINEGGIFVETESPQAVGTSVSLQFTLPGIEDPLEVAGTVVHLTGDDTSEPLGMGIEFEELDGEARQRINGIVRRLRAGL